MSQQFVASVVQVLGLVVLVAAAAIVSPVVGVATAGVVLLVIGVALELSARNR